MKLAVIGATGGVGQRVIQLAIQKKHEVVALVRDIDKCLEQQQHLEVGRDARLSVEQVDLFDAESIKDELEGVDAVICCLAPNDFWSYWYCTILSESIQNIVLAMENTGVKRLVYCSTWGSESRAENPFLFEWVVKPLYLGSICRDFRRAELYIERVAEEKGLVYTILRLPRLHDHLSYGLQLRSEVGSTWVPGCMHESISRSQVAKMILQCVEDGVFVNQDVAVGHKSS